MDKNNKNIILIFLFITAFFLLGCATASSKTKEIDVFVGTEGLTAEFLKNAPPPRVFESSNFPILLRVRNKGTYNIGSNDQTVPGIITLGRETDYVTELTLQENSRASQEFSSENEIHFSVEGRSRINPAGDENVISLTAKTGKLEPQSETKVSTIAATLCYPYQTVLSTTVCIDPDIAGISPAKKACSAKDQLFNNGQGAPIAITKIEVQMIPKDDKIIPQFLIYVENKGKGDAVDPDSYQNPCGIADFTDDTRKKDIKTIWNVAFLRAYSSGKKDDENNQLICRPNINDQSSKKETVGDNTAGFIKFIDKKDFVRCTFKEGKPKNFDAFASPLRIEIDYGYVQTFAANFIIQKPLTH